MFKRWAWDPRPSIFPALASWDPQNRKKAVCVTMAATPSPPPAPLPLKRSSQAYPRKIAAAKALAAAASASWRNADAARTEDLSLEVGCLVTVHRMPPPAHRRRGLRVVGCWSIIAAIATTVVPAAAAGAYEAKTTTTTAIMPRMRHCTAHQSNHHAFLPREEEEGLLQDSAFPAPSPSALHHHHHHPDRHSQSQHPFQPRGRINDDNEAPASRVLRPRLHHHPFSLAVRGGARAAAVQAVRPGPTPPRRTPPRDDIACMTETKATKTSSTSTSTATLLMTFNLVKGILGSGILALPAGMATTISTNHVSAIAPATILLALTGFVAAYGFALLGILCNATGATTYREVWIATVGKQGQTTKGAAAAKKGGSTCQTAWIPAAACMAVTFCTTLTYLMVLADTVPQLLRPILNGIQLSRATTLIGLGTILAPLCLLRDLKKLAPVSIVGLIGTLYTALAMAFRWYQHVAPSASSHSPAPAVSYISQLLDVTHYWKHLKSPALFLSMLSTSFMAHYNAPRVYWELRNGIGTTTTTTGGQPSTASPPSSSVLPTYLTVVQWGFGAATAVMALIAASGFAVFGQTSKPNILSSYPSTDSALALGRAAIALSLVCTFPLAFVGIRNQLLELVVLPSQDGKSTSNITTTSTTLATFGLLAILVAAAHRVRDLRLVLAVGGMLRCADHGGSPLPLTAGLCRQLLRSSVSHTLFLFLPRLSTPIARTHNRRQYVGQCRHLPTPIPHGVARGPALPHPPSTRVSRCRIWIVGFALGVFGHWTHCVCLEASIGPRHRLRKAVSKAPTTSKGEHSEGRETRSGAVSEAGHVAARPGHSFCYTYWSY